MLVLAGGISVPLSRATYARWAFSAKAPLPGGDFAWDGFDNEVDEVRERWRFLGEDQARRLVAAYGSNAKVILGDAKARSDLGPAFGPELTAAARFWSSFTTSRS